MHPLDPSRSSAQRKLARGIEQLETLLGEATAFENGEAYVFRVEEERRSPYEVKYRAFARERQPAPWHWPLLAGEMIQNFRSALDHAVYSCAAAPSRERTQYPIFTDATEFQTKGLGMLPGVPVQIRTAIEETQPYRRLPQAPARDALEQLRTLSNIDKHRTLTSFATVVHHESWSHGYGVSVTIEEIATNRPLSHGEAQISEFTGISETEFGDVDVHPDFAYQVRIEGRPLDVFAVIARRVFEGVTVCENGGQALSPFAAYPI